ncbi:MAG: ABC-2 family transporter protein [Candidatus Edwardsbacteria bacterium]
MRAKFAKYWEFMKVGYLTFLTYRFQVVMNFISYFLLIALNYFLWKAIYTQKATISGLTLSQMLTYVVIAWSARSFFANRIDREIGMAVREGTIAMDLIKPTNFQIYHYCRAFGRALFMFLFMTLPLIVLACFIFPVQPPSGRLGPFLFPISVVLSFFLNAGLSYLTGVIAFFTKNNEGVLHFKQMLIEVFSGVMIPITFFPGWIQDILFWLPFKYIAYAPLRIYLGLDSIRKVHQGVLLQMMWIVIIYLAGQLLWHYAVRKVEIQGG